MLLCVFVVSVVVIIALLLLVIGFTSLHLLLMMIVVIMAATNIIVDAVRGVGVPRRPSKTEGIRKFVICRTSTGRGAYKIFVPLVVGHLDRGGEALGCRGLIERISPKPEIL